jgi:hypothetical protein
MVLDTFNICLYSKVWFYKNGRGNVNQVGDFMTFLLRLLTHLRDGEIFHPCQNLSAVSINKDPLTSEVAVVDGYCVRFAVLCPIVLCETYKDGRYENMNCNLDTLWSMLSELGRTCGMDGQT